MAHLNIDERRIAVKEKLGERDFLSPKERIPLAQKYGCSISAIYQDEISFMKIKHQIKENLYTTKTTKQRISVRDNKCCQYCGEKERLLIAEHVIPTCLGGNAQEYNIVQACHSCNMKKRSEIWIPRNIDKLMNINKKWAIRIIKEATKSCVV